VRGSVIYATFVVALVFLPVLSLSGVAGKLFAPLGEAYVVAVFASLAVALTVIPALAYLMLAHTPAHRRDHAWIRTLKAGQARILIAITDHSRPLIAGTAVLFLAALAVLQSFGSNFLPTFREHPFIVHVPRHQAHRLPSLCGSGTAFRLHCAASGPCTRWRSGWDGRRRLAPIPMA